VIDQPRYWFSTRQFGFGYRAPISWEGWTVDLVSCALVVAVGLWIRVHPQGHPLLQLGFFFALLASEMAIRHWKGEPQAWG
jgi:hypothetical protein